MYYKLWSNIISKHDYLFLLKMPFWEYQSPLTKCQDSEIGTQNSIKFYCPFKMNKQFMICMRIAYYRLMRNTHVSQCAGTFKPGLIAAMFNSVKPIFLANNMEENFNQEL